MVNFYLKSGIHILSGACLVYALTGCGSTMEGLGDDFKSLSAKIGTAVKSGKSKKEPSSSDEPKLIKTNSKSNPNKAGSDLAKAINTQSEVRKGYSKNMVQQVQEKLNTLGYDAGDANGSYSASTEAAIQDFQLDNDLAVDGRPSISLLRVINTRLDK